MRIGYFDCFAGIAGDMALGAVIDAGCDIEELKKGLKSMKRIADEWELEVDRVKRSKGRIAAKKANVVITSNSSHHHRNLADIQEIIHDSELFSTEVKEQCIQVFQILAEAEAKVHGCAVNEIHFHEVGAIDSIIDTVGTVYGLNLLGIKELYCSSLPMTCGTVKTEHGYLPVPAPATLILSANHLSFCSPQCESMSGELVTPTGASILRALVKRENTSAWPHSEWTLSSIGVGAGSRDPEEYPNICRLFVGEERTNLSDISETICVLESNLDDISGEIAGYASQLLNRRSDVLDSWLTPIQMKKNRPGFLLSVLCRPNDTRNLIELMVKKTTTIGVRVKRMDRIALKRSVLALDTKLGEIHVKVAYLNNHLVNAAPEFEDCKAIAEKMNIPLKQVYQIASSTIVKKLALDQPCIDRT